MKMTQNTRYCLTAMLALSAVLFTASSFAQTSKLVIESGDSAQSRQNAAMDKEHPLFASQGQHPHRKRVGQG